MTEFKLQVYTQEKKIYDDVVTSIVVPGLDGYIGVLAHHAPLLSVLGEGKLTIRKGAAQQIHHISGGFLEFRDNVASILVDKLTQAG